MLRRGQGAETGGFPKVSLRAARLDRYSSEVESWR